MPRLGEIQLGAQISRLTLGQIINNGHKQTRLINVWKGKQVKNKVCKSHSCAVFD